MFFNAILYQSFLHIYTDYICWQMCFFLYNKHLIYNIQFLVTIYYQSCHKQQKDITYGPIKYKTLRSSNFFCWNHLNPWSQIVEISTPSIDIILDYTQIKILLLNFTVQHTKVNLSCESDIKHYYIFIHVID